MEDAGKIVAYWREHAKYDLDTADSLLSSGRFPYCLFMCHLAIEKILKGIIVEKIKDHAPYTHNLIELASGSGMDFSSAQQSLIAELNEFNLEARYPDWKRDFYKTATKEFSADYLAKTKELFVWLTQ